MQFPTLSIAWAKRLCLSGRTAGLALIVGLIAVSQLNTPAASAAGLHLGARSPMSVSQAPVGLRAAVLRAVDSRNPNPGWQQTELTPSDTPAYIQFGYSVAISGSTAVVGTYASGPSSDPNSGAAYVFTQSGTSWVQAAEIKGTTPYEYVGAAVATNGSTVVIGAPGAGEVFVYTQSGSSWIEQAELTASDASSAADFGNAVAISGNTIVAGANGENSSAGAAYVFAESGSTWSQQAKLTAPDGAAEDDFGGAVAISGSTLVVGAQGHHTGTGAAYVFVLSGNSWSQQAELTASDGAQDDAFGCSVAISGENVVVGAYGKNSFTGAAYVFTQSGTAWSQEAELGPGVTTPADFGGSVAISGATAVVGADAYNSDAGAAFVFSQSGLGWGQSARLMASDRKQNAELGASVGIDGANVIAGAPGKNSFVGGAYIFTDYGVPTVNSVAAPASGPLAGGNTLTIHGANFIPGYSTVDFGTAASPSVSVISGSEIQAVAPAASGAGSVDVVVTTPGGTSGRSPRDLYAYGAPTISSFGPPSGITGSAVTITGSGFAAGIVVSFGSLQAKFEILSGTSLTATVPNGAQAAAISIADPQGTATSASQFIPTLSIYGFTPGSGPSGTVVMISGVGFTAQSTVAFDGTPAVVTSQSATQLVVTVPSGATSGHITVTNPSGSSPAGTVTSRLRYSV